MAFEKYRSLPNDPDRGVPGPRYWTTPVVVRTSSLRSLKTVLLPSMSRSNAQRMNSIREAHRRGITLPPIEVGVDAGGSAWLVDGNHRLAEARKARRPVIEVTFAFEL
jgi:hypothetical protein